MRLMAVLAAIVSIAVLCTPIVVYEVYLAQVEGRPSFATQTYPTKAREDIEAKLKVPAGRLFETHNPYSYLYEFYRQTNAEPPSRSLYLAWLVARDHNARYNEPTKGNTWWLLAGISLTIWLTRSWTEQQIQDKLIELYAEKKG